MNDSDAKDDDIIRWYLVGCHIIQDPKLDKFRYEKFVSFLKTLFQMAGDYGKD